MIGRTPGERLKIAIKQRGIKPADFAADLGIVRQTLYKWFDDQGFTEEKQRQAAAHLKISFDELRTGEPVAVGNIDPELLSRVIAAVHLSAAQHGIELTIPSSAKVMAAVYRTAADSKKVDPAIVDAIVSALETNGQ